MSSNEFVLPDVGEGLTEAEIVSWAVQSGDTVHLNQVICEIETEKSLVEIPSPFEGEIAELLVEPGTTVPVGTPILRMVGAVEAAAEPGTRGAVAEDRGAVVGDREAITGDRRAAAEGREPAAEDREADEDDREADTENPGAVLVGYGVGGPLKSRRQPGREPFVEALWTAPDSQPVPGKAYAKPPVRKLAKDLGVDLARLTGTGRDGEILRDDVRAAGSTANAAAPSSQRDAAAAVPREERIPVKGVRRAVAAAMVESKFTAPHTSVFVEADATRTMKLVRRLRETDAFADVRISPLVIMAKAILRALERNPEVNSAWAGDEIIRRNYVNLGIAAATPRGLVVPNIKDAQELTLPELAAAIATLTQRARDGVTQPAEMQHGTITITNVGVFGVDFGLPILNPGETAIIGMGAIRKKPWVVNNRVRPRMVTTVGGSFDHRVIDGDVISRFVTDIAAVLERPELLLV